MFAPFGSTVIAGVSMLIVYLASLDQPVHVPGLALLPKLAALLLLVSFVDTGRRRRHGRRAVAESPIFP